MDKGEMIDRNVKRLARKIKGTPSQIERVRAARAIIEAQRSPRAHENLKLAAFMEIFHPGREYNPSDFETE